MPVCTAQTCPGAVSWAGVRWFLCGQAQPALTGERTTGPGATARLTCGTPRGRRAQEGMYERKG